MTSTARVLVVEDEPDMAAIVNYALREGGLEPRVARSAEEALLLMLQEPFDLAIVDVGLPGRNGFEFCREVRSRRDLPLIILTAHTEAEDRIEGFESGADDYVAKPFNPRELVLRVRAVLARSSKTGRANIHIGALTIDTTTATAVVNRREVPLTPIEFRLLHSLASQPGTVLSDGRLLHDVWGSNQYLGGKNLLKATVYRLRRTLTAAGLPSDLIQSRRGQGYVLDPEADA